MKTEAMDKATQAAIKARLDAANAERLRKIAQGSGGTGAHAG